MLHSIRMRCCLSDHYHKFTVEDIVAQFELYCEELILQLDPTTGVKIDTSIQSRFEIYDNYTFDDFGLSRLVVESLLTSSLFEQIITKFGNDTKFKTYPGQILCMMALDACNASVQRDIAGVQTKFDNLTLDDYSGEDITGSTEAL